MTKIPHYPPLICLRLTSVAGAVEEGARCALRILDVRQSLRHAVPRADVEPTASVACRGTGGLVGNEGHQNGLANWNKFGVAKLSLDV